MPSSKIGGLPITGRKSAALIRSRLTILLAAQSVFATKGSAAAIEDIAAEAGVSVSTLYKHFANKEDLFQAAFKQAFTTWETWVAGTLTGDIEQLEGLIMPMRILVRSPETHPVFANMLSNNLGEVSGQLISFADSLHQNLKFLAKHKLVNSERLSARTELVMTILLHLVQKRVLQESYKATDADKDIAIAMQMLGIDAERVDQITSAPMPSFETATP